MAERLWIDHQRLQQSITSATWDHSEVRRVLALRMSDVVAPEAYDVDDVHKNHHHRRPSQQSPDLTKHYRGATAGTALAAEAAAAAKAVAPSAATALQTPFHPKAA